MTPATVPNDRDRANDLVVVGTRWYGWGHHHAVVDERVRDGVREVRLVRDVRGDKGMMPGPITKKAQPGEWIAAWRVQKFCNLTTKEDE